MRGELATFRGEVVDGPLVLTRPAPAALHYIAFAALVPWIKPRGGFHLWCRLSEGLDAAVVAQGFVEDKVVLAPGNVFSVSQSAASFLRFNVAQLADKRILSAIKKAISAPGSYAAGWAWIGEPSLPYW